MNQVHEKNSNWIWNGSGNILKYLLGQFYSNEIYYDWKQK
jgi:hypothetical protein